ncbi:MAG: hypothetical protein F6K48_12230 [Okeania sp. SIO3H1]|nr:hypothetical protein [Okeania sp. SIO3H1]
MKTNLSYLCKSTIEPIWYLFKNRGEDGEMGRWPDGEMGGWGDGGMARWGDESIFLSAREATRCAIGQRGVASAFSPILILVPEFPLARSD